MKTIGFQATIVAILFLAVGPAFAVPVQWTTGTGANNHFYEVVALTGRWTSAKADAESKGGYLATITSAEENAFVYSIASSTLTNFANASGWMWLGGYQTSKLNEPAGDWAWVTGETWSYTNWKQSPLEPNNAGNIEDYLMMWSDGNGTWNDLDNNPGINYYVFEQDAPASTVPEPGTILLLGAGLAGMALSRRGKNVTRR
jgi:hypothetical protein